MDEGANRQSRAALNAMFAKNWLLAGESSSADDTEPSGLTCARTLIRTVPRIVLRAFAETSGTTRCTTSIAPELGVAAERDEAAGGFDAGAGVDEREDALLAGADSLADGLVLVALEGGALFDPDFVATDGDEEDEVSAVLRSIRGTISNARTRVPAAPMMKYFNEPLDARALGTRRGAAIVTFTLGSDETGICDGALGLSKPGETGESGTESGLTGGSGAATRDTRLVAAPETDACAATASGGCAAAVSGSVTTGAATASTRASGVGAATGFGLGTYDGSRAARTASSVIRSVGSWTSAPRITSANGLGNCGNT